MVAGRYLTVGLACAAPQRHRYRRRPDRRALAVSTLFSFGIVVAIGYRLHTTWTFPGAVRSGTSFARYTVMASANYPLTIAGLFVFVDLWDSRFLLRVPL